MIKKGKEGMLYYSDLLSKVLFLIFRTHTHSENPHLITLLLLTGYLE